MKGIIGAIFIVCCSLASFAIQPDDSIRVNFMRSSHIHNFFVYWDYNYNYEINKREKVEAAGFYGYERFICDYFSVRFHAGYNFEENLWYKSHKMETGVALNYYIPIGKKLFLGIGGAYTVDAFKRLESEQEEWFNSTSSNVVGIASLDYFVKPHVSIGLFNSNEVTFSNHTYRNRTWLGVRYFLPPNFKILNNRKRVSS